MFFQIVGSRAVEYAFGRLFADFWQAALIYYTFWPHLGIEELIRNDKNYLAILKRLI